MKSAGRKAGFTEELSRPRPAIIRDAVEIAVDICHPVAVYIFGPTAKNYVYGGRVTMLVIVKRGDTDKIWDEIMWALADRFIDGDVYVLTAKLFEEYKDDSCSVSYSAVKTGFVAYAS